MSDELQAHPLFPPKDDEDDPPIVEGFHVTRLEGGGVVYCRHLFAADELTTLEQLHELFGGGNYELVARDGSRITAKRKYNLGGAPKPLNPGDPLPMGASAPAVAVAAPANGGGAQWVALVASLLPPLLTFVTQLIQSGQTAAAQQTQLLMTMLANNETKSQQFMQSLTAVQSAAAQAQSTVLSSLIEKLGAGAGAPEPGASFKDGIEYASSFVREAMERNGGEDDATTGAILQTLAQMGQGIMLGKQPPAAPAAPPNGAATE